MTRHLCQRLSATHRLSAARSGRGFTLVELIVVLAVATLILTLTLPALQNFIHRSKIEGIARETATMMQAARFESIKRSRRVLVKADTAAEEVVVFVDEDDDDAVGDAEPVIARYQLPSGVDFAAPPGQPAIEGFANAGTEWWAVFNPDGSAEVAGGFRFGDPRGNFLESRIEIAATARVSVQKWQDGAWLEKGEGGGPWRWS